MQSIQIKYLQEILESLITENSYPLELNILLKWNESDGVNLIPFEKITLLTENNFVDFINEIKFIKTQAFNNKITLKCL